VKKNDALPGGATSSHCKDRSVKASPAVNETKDEMSKDDTVYADKKTLIQNTSERRTNF
jgi:hypothetical protein